MYAASFSAIRKEYNDMFNNLLSNCGSIITDTFNIEFHKNQKLNQLAFPPTIYEFLWRYEYIQFKDNLDPITKEYKNKVEMNFDDKDNAEREKRLIMFDGSVFFEKKILNILSNQKFEYQH